MPDQPTVYGLPVLPRRIVWCRHFTGTHAETCRAGVRYADVQVAHAPTQYTVEGEPNRVRLAVASLPCSKERDLSENGCECDNRDILSAEEVAAEDAAMEEMARRVLLVADAVEARWGKFRRPTKTREAMPAVGGRLDCPVCKVPGALGAARAVNGHVRARCHTAGCVSFIQ